jgi:DNA repair exonuclease SbcCD nuclease subunit
MGFTSFYCKETKLSSINVINNNKPNILVMHASLDGGVEENREYNPISESRLESLGMDYIALGHVHKPYYNEKPNQKIVYPGSTISLGFDEIGPHGMIVGDLNNGKLELEFVKLDDTQFAKIEQNVDSIFSKEELIEKINDLKLEENIFYEIVLVGNRNFEINTREILKFVNNQNILKIKDLTQIKYELEKIKNENTLKGLFIKEVLNKQLEGEYSDEEIQKAIEIGLNALH